MDAEKMLTLAGIIAGALGSYHGAKAAMQVQIARLEERLHALEKRFDSDHARLDEHLSERA